MLCPYASAQELEPDLRRALDAMAGERREGGWAMKWAKGQGVVWGEHRPVAEHVITVQPPATPGVASMYVIAAAVLDEEKYLHIAREARDALLAVQTEHGGFPHEWDARKGPGGYGSFDDGTTTGPLAFFHMLWAYTGDDEDLAALKSVGEFLLTSQYENGGWPQSYPLRESGYSRYITMNDNAMPNAIRACLRMYEALGDERYLEAAKRGGDCLIELQGGEGEEVWAQQYDPETMEPAWARKFEPPGYTPAESIAVCDVLIDIAIATGDEKYLAPLPKAFAWYDTVVLENGLRARLYEPGTRRPVYGRRDKAEKVYDFASATDGYGWQGNWYPSSAKSRYDEIQERGLDAVRGARLSNDEEAARLLEHLKANSEGNIAGALEVLQKLDDDGLWTANANGDERSVFESADVAADTPMISTRDFVSNINAVLQGLIRSEEPALLMVLR